MGVELTGVEQTGVKKTGVELTGVKLPGVELTGIEQQRLHIYQTILLLPKRLSLHDPNSSLRATAKNFTI